jgi:hypothetical protein
MAAVPLDAFPLVALHDIKHNGVLAYAAGDPVSEDAAKNLGLLLDSDVEQREETPADELPAAADVTSRRRLKKAAANSSAGQNTGEQTGGDASAEPSDQSNQDAGKE